MPFKVTERMIYISSDGRSYPLHVPPQRVVMQEEGFGMPPIEYVTDRAPFQHGDNVRSFFLGPRAIQLVIMHNFCSRAEYWAGRNALISAIRPMSSEPVPSTGTIRYYLTGGWQRALDVHIDSGPGFVPAEGGWREWSFTEALRFTAHDPIWYDPNGVSQTLLYVQPRTDLVFPATFPIVFSSTSGLRTQIKYSGTWPDYPTLVVYGPVTGFTILNETSGKKLGLTAPIPDGYTVTFKLRGLKTVVGSDGANWLNRLSSDSDLTTFALIPPPSAAGGVNVFALGGTGTNASSRVVVSYNHRYIGI